MKSFFYDSFWNPSGTTLPCSPSLALGRARYLVSRALDQIQMLDEWNETIDDEVTSVLRLNQRDTGLHCSWLLGRMGFDEAHGRLTYLNRILTATETLSEEPPSNLAISFAFASEAPDRDKWAGQFDAALPSLVFKPPVVRGHVTTGVVTAQEAKEAVWRGLTRPQRAAAKTLRHLMTARFAAKSFGQLQGDWHGFVLGPSGSGKSHLIKAFATCADLEYVGMNFSSWLPLGSKADIPTLSKIVNIVGSDTPKKGWVIHLDEICKIRTDGTHSDWNRYLTDELMALLDGRLEVVQGVTPPILDRLRNRCFICVSGAFESITSAPLSEYEIAEGMTKLHRFRTRHWLPAELFNRLSIMPAMLESPTPSEISALAREALEDALCRKTSDEEVREIVESGQASGMALRGLQAAVFSKWAAEQDILLRERTRKRRERENRK